MHEEQKDDVLVREERKDDALAHEERKGDIALTAPQIKKTISRIKRNKPKMKTATVTPSKHICDVPIFIDMSVLNDDKQKQLRQALETDQHNITLKDVIIKGRHILAMASVSVPSLPPKIKIQKSNLMNLMFEPVRSKKKDTISGKQEKKKIITFHNEKQFDPP